MSEKKAFGFIHYLRVIGMLLVMWPHLAANLNPEWHGVRLVQQYVNTPLCIGQNFGFLGVVLFFIISGFLIAFQTGSAKEFLWKKLKAIVLPLWFSLFLFFLFEKMFSIFSPTY
ncbi:MAG: acyltransferase family protein, partial [Pygmaiobacter sp.]